MRWWVQSLRAADSARLKTARELVEEVLGEDDDDEDEADDSDSGEEVL
jgi:hypothetical protein